MEIYLLRHGIAESARPGMKDADRALTEEGREKLGRVLKRAKGAGVDPDLILSSPYRRAMETAEQAALALGYANKIISTPALVPGASPFDVWEELRGRHGESSILLASHEPLMSSLIAFLLGNPAMLVDIKKAALARVDCDRLGSEPQATLKWLITPATAGE
jgi:phosphohistidine phosphatase